MNKLIIGLGNPGSKYSETRHNLGQMVLDSLAKLHNLNFQKSFKGEYAQYSEGDVKIILLKPHTFMNLSGESIIQCKTFYKIEMENILILHDELDLNFGTVSFKDGGGLAGHNGLKSIAENLATQNFKRFRLGIGRPIHGDVSDYVLSSFFPEEKIVLAKYIAESVVAVEDFLKNNFSFVLNKYNKRSLF